MGIRGLTSFVDTLPFGERQVWESFDLRDTNLVIDGCGLYFYIYKHNKLNCKFGGQYDELQNKVKEFISKLLQNNVKPYVVIDGIMDRNEKKSATCTERKKQKIAAIEILWTSNDTSALKRLGYEVVLPRLAQLAIVQVLQEMKVPYAVADFEADCDIASLANKLGAPVLASDSDFCIFNIQHGYIPLKYYNFSGPNITITKCKQRLYCIFKCEADCEIASIANKLNAPVLSNDSDFCIFNISRGYIPFKHLKFSRSNIAAKKFSSDAFARHLGINPSMLPFLASLVGNDYISDKMLKPFHDHIDNLVAAELDADMEETKKRELIKERRVPTIARFVSKHKSDLELAIRAVIDLFPKDHDTASFRKTLDLSIKEYQMKQSNLIDYFDSGDLSCNMRTYNGHPLPPRVVKLYRQGLIASEGLDCLCNRKIFLGIQSEDVTLPSAQICAQGLRWRYYKLILNCENTSNTDSTSQATTEATTEDIVVTEFDRKGSTFDKQEVNPVREVPEINVEIHDIPRMSEESKNSHILGLLDSDVPSICKLSPEHQMVAAAMRYWVIHSQIKPAHLAALLVHYVDKNCSSSTTKEYLKISLEAVHGFAQWQNVLYWAQRWNTLFSSTFSQLQVAKLYDGIRVCKVYEKLRISGITFAESIVTNKDEYRHLYDAITKELPRDCQFNQSRSRERQRNKEDRLEQKKKTKNKNSELLKENRFEFLCSSDSDED